MVEFIGGNYKNEDMIPTKEELVELIGMADILEAKLNDMGNVSAADDADYISYVLRGILNEVCGMEYLEQQRKVE